MNCNTKHVTREHHITLIKKFQDFYIVPSKVVPTPLCQRLVQSSIHVLYLALMFLLIGLI